MKYLKTKYNLIDWEDGVEKRMFHGSQSGGVKFNMRIKKSEIIYPIFTFNEMRRLIFIFKLFKLN